MKSFLTAILPLRAVAALHAVVVALVLLALAPAARSHEVLPSIADMTVVDGVLEFAVQANLEGFVAGIDLSDVNDTGEAAEAATYDALRAMEPDDLEQRFRVFWPQMAEKIVIRTDQGDLEPELTEVEVPEVGNPELVRPSVVRFGGRCHTRIR